MVWCLCFNNIIGELKYDLDRKQSSVVRMLVRDFKESVTLTRVSLHRQNVTRQFTMIELQWFLIRVTRLSSTSSDSELDEIVQDSAAMNWLLINKLDSIYFVHLFVSLNTFRVSIPTSFWILYSCRCGITKYSQIDSNNRLVLKPALWKSLSIILTFNILVSCS